MARISKIQQEMKDKFEAGEVETATKDIDYKELVDKLGMAVADLICRVKVLEERPVEVKRKSGINKVEQFNGEVETIPDDNRGIKMTYEDKITSMRNAAKILPPNMIENGRHIKENIQAICGFIVDEDMMDEMYTGFSHNED